MQPIVERKQIAYTSLAKIALDQDELTSGWQLSQTWQVLVGCSAVMCVCSLVCDVCVAVCTLNYLTMNVLISDISIVLRQHKLCVLGCHG